MMKMTRIGNLLVGPVGLVCSLLFMSSSAHAYMWNGLEITPRVSAGETYDSNVTQVKNGSLSDMRTDLSAGLSIIREGKTQNFKLDGDVTRQIFNRHSGFDNTAETLNAQYGVELSKYSHLSFSNEFSHSAESVTFADAFGNNNGRYSRYNNIFNMEYGHDMTEQLAVKAGYINDRTDNAIASRADSVMNGVNFGLDYALDSFDILSSEYSLRKREFDRGSSATVHELSGNYRHFLTKKLYADFQTGVDVIDSYNEQNYVKPLYRMRLTRDLDENTQASILLEKQYILPSSTADLFNSWRFSANFDRQLTARLSVGIKSFYGEGEYLTLDETNKFTGLETGLMYDLTKKSKFSLNYIFSKEESTTVNSGYIRNVVFAGVTTGF